MRIKMRWKEKTRRKSSGGGVVGGQRKAAISKVEVVRAAKERRLRNRGRRV